MKNTSWLRKSLPVLAALIAVAICGSAPADDRSNIQPLADKKGQALPLSHSIEKGTPGEYGGPFVLKLKNTSHAALKVSAAILQSVVSHNRPKTIDLPARTIEAGGTWDISDLAAEDKVTVAGDGYDKLEVTIRAPKSENK